jgi:hypothetical protein
MCATRREPPELLLLGRRALQELPSVALIQDLVWLEADSRWMLEVEVTSQTTSEYVPVRTRWCLLLRDDYPRGGIDIHPAKADGIVATFPHQSRNDEGDSTVRWRTGKVCVAETVWSLGRLGGGKEPRTAAGRLLWHIDRLVSWLAAAANGTLTQAGDPFELPDFRRDDSLVVVFEETAESFDAWRASGAHVGVATLRPLRVRRGGVRAVTEFRSERGPVIKTQGYEGHVEGKPSTALWVRLPGLPVLKVWRAPRTWRELRAATAAMGFDLDGVLRPNLAAIRKEESPLVLVGFAVPEQFGDQATHLHWQAIRLPKLGIPAKGWRDNERGFRQRERDILADDQRIAWMITENWARGQINRRSQLPHLSQRRVLLIGAGAIGSLVAELLVRGGVSDITVMDPEDVEIGNLVRHTLMLSDVRDRKANALAMHLNRLGPAVKATPRPILFPPEGNQRGESLGDRDLVIDCTADDDVLDALRTVTWADDARVVSMSVGLGAKRLYCDLQSPPFDAVAFRQSVAPHLQRDHSEFSAELPWDATGCWHPLFPGRLDELWSLVATAVGRLETWLQDGSADRLLVVERLDDGGIAIR